MNRNRITATALIVAAAFAAATATAASAATVPACRPSQLHLTLGHERASTGHITWTLTARNNGPACTLAGFPHLGLEDARGNPLRSVTTRTGKAEGGLLLFGLTAQAGISYGSDGMTGERPSYLTAGGNVAPCPGGPALVYGGQLTETSWVLPKQQ